MLWVKAGSVGNIPDLESSPSLHFLLEKLTPALLCPTQDCCQVAPAVCSGSGCP